MITGKKKDIIAIEKLLKTKDNVFDFNKIIPYPTAYKILDEAAQNYSRLGGGDGYPISDGYNQGGYDWCTNNWGTKWNSSDANIFKCKNTLHYTFQTAWCPPTNILEKLSLLFPKLNISLTADIEGCDTIVNYEYADGKEFCTGDTAREEYEENS